MSSRTKKDRLEHPSAKKRIPYSCVLEFLYTCILKSQRLFMPNKPNFKLSKITASNFLNMTSAYCPRPTACKNKANHTNPAKRQYSLHGKHDPGRHPESSRNPVPIIMPRQTGKKKCRASVYPIDNICWEEVCCVKLGEEIRF